MLSLVADQTLHVVLIDDDPAHLELIAQSLKLGCDASYPLDIKTYQDADEALIDLPPEGKVVILCDNHLGVTTGLDWLPDFIQADVGPVILMTSQGDEKTVASAFQRGAADYANKESIFEHPERFWNMVSEALRRFKLNHSNRDLSRKLKVANQKLEERNAELKSMTETAHRFVDNVAHEFRTPLTVIQEFASILQDGIGGEVNDEQATYLGYIETGVHDLSTLIDDFLDTSKLKARVLRVNRQRTTVAEVFEHAQMAAHVKAKSKSVRVTFDREQDLPPVYCDCEKASRVITNLVVNAVKFSQERSRVEVRACSTGNGEVEISVRDHGVGIAEDQLARLCERFEQAIGSGRGAEKGYGLGLDIARNLICLNLGKMRIDSTVGEGSTFSFTLPSADPEQVLHCYTRRIEQYEPYADVGVMRIQTYDAKTRIEDVQQVLSQACQSMDLLISSCDGRSLMALGPTEKPDNWIERMQQAWAMGSTGGQPPPPLHIEWMGSWPVRRLTEYAVPLITKNLIESRRCA